MAKLVWDKIGDRFYETGVDQGVLYDFVNGAYVNGVAWNGLTAVNESPSGAEPSPLYADNIKYLNLISNEDYGFTIEAYTYPDEFEKCDGSQSLTEGVYVGQQTRKIFGFCWRTLVGNDTDGTDHGYKLHLAYNCLASPSERSHATVNDSPEAATLSWEVSTTPVAVVPMEGETLKGSFKPTAKITIDSTKADATKLAALEAILYGGENTEARMPLPGEVAKLMS